MKYHEMTKNYVFRELICNLSREETANLCFKTVTEIVRWDKGKPIPKECRRLMRMHRKLDLSHFVEWEGFSMQNGKLMLPTGQLLSPQQILIGSGLLEIQSELEIKTSNHIVRIARAMSKMMLNKKSV